MAEENRQIRVFLCHASDDKVAVQELYQRLVKDGVDAWLDKEKLIPGQDWHLEITRAVENSDVVLVCLSAQSITKEGYIQREIKFALDKADEKPEGTIFIVPVRLQKCDLPKRLSKIHWVDLFEDNGYEQLLKALHARAKGMGVRIGDQLNLGQVNSGLVSSSRPFAASETQTVRTGIEILYKARWWSFYTTVTCVIKAQDKEESYPLEPNNWTFVPIKPNEKVNIAVGVQAFFGGLEMAAKTDCELQVGDVRRYVYTPPFLEGLGDVFLIRQE